MKFQRFESRLRDTYISVDDDISEAYETEDEGNHEIVCPETG
jgi:hypothetical protein